VVQESKSLKYEPASVPQATYMCITHMEAYKNYSFEELRVGDYAMNRKKKEAGAGGMFGAAAQVLSSLLLSSLELSDTQVYEP